MKLVYPAIFSPWDDGDGYTVEVPDLPGCVTEGATLADAILMAQDAASGWVLDELEEGRPAPAASAMEDIHADAGGLVSLVSLDMEIPRRRLNLRRGIFLTELVYSSVASTVPGSSPNTGPDSVSGALLF